MKRKRDVKHSQEKRKKRKLNTEDDLFEINVESDYANVSHCKLFSGDIPNYRLCSKSTFLLGYPNLDVINAGTVLGKDLLPKLDTCDLASTQRYFSDYLSLQFRDKNFEQIRLMKRTWKPEEVQKGLLEILVKEKNDERKKDISENVIQEIICIEGDDIPNQTLDEYKYQMTAQLNASTRENPLNISSWCALADFQDFTQKNRKVKADRVMSIYRKALDYNQNSDQLLLRYVRLANDVPEKADILWDKILREHPTKPYLYKEYFTYRLTQPDFSVTKIREHAIYLLKVLRSARNKLFDSTKFHDGTNFFYDLSSIEETCWTVYRQLILLERQSGYTERSMAMVQAILEFNWFAPPQLLYEERLMYFEAFWESNCPRVGENNAPGWKTWHEKFISSEEEISEYEYEDFPKGNISSSKHVIWSADGTHGIPKNLPSGSHNHWIKTWLKKEEKLSVEEWLPFHGEPEDVEDLNRFVLFDDLKEILFEISDETLKQKIVIDAMATLGIPEDIIKCGLKNDILTETASSYELFETFSNVLSKIAPYADPEKAMQLLKNQYVVADVEDEHDALAWLQSTMGKGNNEQVFKKVYGPQITDQNLLFAWNLMSQMKDEYKSLCFKGLVIALANHVKGIEAARNLSKSFLKHDSTNLRLWNIYAQLELKNNNIKSCKKVYKTALKLLSNVPTNETRYAPLLFWEYFDLEFSRLNHPSEALTNPLCWNLLLSCCEGSYVPFKKKANMDSVAKTRLLCASQRFPQLLESNDSLIWECERIVENGNSYKDLGSVPVPAGVYIGFCYAYFTLLTSGVHEAKDVIKKYVMPRIKQGVGLDWVLIQLQKLVERGAQIKNMNPKIITHTLLESLQFVQHDISLFSKMLQEVKGIPRIKLSLYFDALLGGANHSSTQSLGYLYLIIYEIQRKTHPNRLRAMFEKCIADAKGRTLTAVWRLYILMELNYWFDDEFKKDAEAIAKDTWFRAVHAVSWSKQLWLEGFKWFGPILVKDELMELLQFCTSKDIRIRAETEMKFD